MARRKNRSKATGGGSLAPAVWEEAGFGAPGKLPGGQLPAENGRKPRAGNSNEPQRSASGALLSDNGELRTESPRQKNDMKKALRLWKISSTAKGFSNRFFTESDNMLPRM